MTAQVSRLLRPGARLRSEPPQVWVEPAPPPKLQLVAVDGQRRASLINPGDPIYGSPTTASVRANFQAAKDEIEELQAEAQTKLSLTGGLMTGPIVFAPNQVIDGGTW